MIGAGAESRHEQEESRPTTSYQHPDEKQMKKSSEDADRDRERKTLDKQYAKKYAGRGAFREYDPVPQEKPTWSIPQKELPLRRKEHHSAAPYHHQPGTEHLGDLSLPHIVIDVEPVTSF